MKKFIFPCALAFALSLPMVALAKNMDSPSECPDVNVIKSEGLTVTEHLPKFQSYSTGNVSHYQTKFSWGFAIAIPENQAISKEDTENKALAAFKSLSGKPTPVFRDDHWFCTYSNAYGYKSVAVTPVD